MKFVKGKIGEKCIGEENGLTYGGWLCESVVLWQHIVLHKVFAVCIIEKEYIGEENGLICRGC